MAKNGNYTKHTRHISIIMHLVRNGEECNLQNTLWYKGGMQMTDIGTNNIREDELNNILGYSMVIIDH